ncbi:hypothetical protein VNO80_08318 [Phaseolus coccineus]|uniref:Uncharacterized protein n=1 Tax=Phaseolus coccineus TaxID=3886 RepID=A0AAN9NLV4_PHACN
MSEFKISVSKPFQKCPSCSWLKAHYPWHPCWKNSSKAMTFTPFTCTNILLSMEPCLKILTIYNYIMSFSGSYYEPGRDGRGRYNPKMPGPLPRIFGSKDITDEFLKYIRFGSTCVYDGYPTNMCFLFSRKFHPNALKPLLLRLSPLLLDIDT